MTLNPERLVEGIQVLRDREPRFDYVISTYGNPPLWDRPADFSSFIKIIVEQSISLKAAAKIFNRMQEHIIEFTPEGFIKIGIGSIKELGLSNGKAKACIAFAKACVQNGQFFEELSSADEKFIHAQLTKLEGIGPWTTHVFILMCLLRADTWPTGDRALVLAWTELRQLKSVIKDRELAKVAEKWSPWRAVAARILWQYWINRKK